MDDEKLESFIEIMVRSNVSGREREYYTSLDISGWPPESVIRQGVLDLAKYAQLNAQQTQPISQIRCGLLGLSEQSRIALTGDLQAFDRDSARAALESVDADFANNPSYSPFAANGYYLAISGLLTRVPGSLRDGSTFSQVAATYSLDRRNRGRRTLPPNPLPHEIAEISHTDVADLRNQTYNALLDRKRAIETAAAKEIEAYDAVLQLQKKLLDAAVCPIRSQKIESWLDLRNYHRSRPDCAVEEFAAVILRWLDKHPPQLDFGWPVGLREPRSFLSSLPQYVAYRHKNCGWPWFFAKHRLPNPLLTTIFILILAHTGWNQASVGALTIDSITKLPTGGYSLQSYKGKTDDETPVSEVPRNLKILCKAIDLLV